MPFLSDEEYSTKEWGTQASSLATQLESGRVTVGEHYSIVASRVGEDGDDGEASRAGARWWKIRAIKGSAGPEQGPGKD